MENENLTELIKNKWFNQFLNGLNSRFSANNIDFNYYYETYDSDNSIVVKLKKNEIESRIELNDDEILSFDYFFGNKKISEKFKNCSTGDFKTMLAYAFIYLRDGNFDYHKEWYDKLEHLK